MTHPCTFEDFKSSLVFPSVEFAELVVVVIVVPLEPLASVTVVEMVVVAVKLLLLGSAIVESAVCNSRLFNKLDL